MPAQGGQWARHLLCTGGQLTVGMHALQVQLQGCQSRQSRVGQACGQELASEGSLLVLIQQYHTV